MTNCPVDACNRPRHPGWIICQHHARTLERDLADVPALTDELNTSLARQTALGAHNGSPNTETPLPFGYRASEATYCLTSTLKAWIAELDMPPMPLGGPAHHAIRLLARINQLRTHPEAHKAVEEITTAVRECWQAIDRRAQLIYCGPCGHEQCQEGLYAALGRANVTCPACDTTHDVEARRDAMRADLHNRLLTVAEIARLASYFDGLDRQRARKLLNQWVHRGHLIAHGLDPRGQETYPFGEVIELLRHATTQPDTQTG